jgi:hypothetical protein
VALVAVAAVAAWNSNKNRPDGRAATVSETGFAVKKSPLLVAEVQETVTNSILPEQPRPSLSLVHFCHQDEQRAGQSASSFLLPWTSKLSE